MANSYQEYTAGNVSSSTAFTTPSYLPGRGATDLVVTVDGQTQSGSAYNLVGTSITFNNAYLPTSGSIIRITRNSSQSARLNDYNDASLLTADALDQDANQLFYVAQEALDTAGETNLAAGTFYFAQGTAPESTVAGTLWYDTASSPNVLKVYSGTGWELTVPVSVKKQYRNAGGDGFIAVTDAGTVTFYNNRSYITDTAFNDKAEVYLNGVRLRSTSSITTVGTTNGGAYFHDASTNRVYFADLPQATDVLEIVTHAGSFSTAIAASEAQAITSAAEAVVSASTATTQAGIATTKAGEAAASAVTAAAQVPLAAAEKTLAIAAKDAAVVAKNAAEAARDNSAVQALATNLANGSTSTINVVAGIESNVTTVSGLSTELGVVSQNAYKTSITTVGEASYKQKVITVADNVSDVTTVANNITAVQGASANASTATTKAAEAATSAATATTQAGIATTKAGEATTTLASTVKVTGNQSVAGVKTFTDKAIFLNDSNVTTVELQSTDADADSGPNLLLRRNSASPSAGDTIGVVSFSGNTVDAQNNIVTTKNFTQMLSTCESSLEGAEGASVVLKGRRAGTMQNFIAFKPVTGTTQWETVFNEGSADVDFRVESNQKTHLIFAEGITNNVGIDNASPQERLDVSGNIKASGTLYASDLVLDDSNPTINLIDNDGSGTGQISQNAQALVLRSVGSGNAFGSVSLQTMDGNGNNVERLALSNAGDFQVFKPNGTKGLFLDVSTGRLGVNKNDDPVATLDVAGDGKFTGELQVGGNTTVTGTVLATISGGAPLVATRINSSGPLIQGNVDSTNVVNVGHDGTSAYLTNVANGGIRVSGTQVKPTINGFNSNDDACDLGAAGSQFKTLYISEGVDFGNSTTNVTNTKLDDYEEGTWTPTYTTNTGNGLGAISYDSLTRGHYTKIGNQVFVHGRIKTTAFNAGTATGTMRIGNLPFGAASIGTQASGNCIIGSSQLFNGYMPITGQVLNNNTHIQLIKHTAPTTNQTTFGINLMTSGTAPGNDVSFSAMYWTNS